MGVPLVCDTGRRALIDEGTAREPIETEMLDQRMGATVRNCMGHCFATGGNRLVPAGAPAAVDEEALDRRLPHDRRRIGRDIDHAGPLAHEAQATEAWEQLEKRADGGLHDRPTAALRV